MEILEDRENISLEKLGNTLKLLADMKNAVARGVITNKEILELKAEVIVDRYNLTETRSKQAILSSAIIERDTQYSLDILKLKLELDSLNQIKMKRISQINLMNEKGHWQYKAPKNGVFRKISYIGVDNKDTTIGLIKQKNNVDNKILLSLKPEAVMFLKPSSIIKLNVLANSGANEQVVVMIEEINEIPESEGSKYAGGYLGIGIIQNRSDLNFNFLPGMEAHGWLVVSKTSLLKKALEYFLGYDND